jgi:hypothetical protein
VNSCQLFHCTNKEKTFPNRREAFPGCRKAFSDHPKAFPNRVATCAIGSRRFPTGWQLFSVVFAGINYILGSPIHPEQQTCNFSFLLTEKVINVLEFWFSRQELTSKTLE